MDWMDYPQVFSVLSHVIRRDTIHAAGMACRW